MSEDQKKMFAKMLGIDDEYNALPVQAKREIDSVMSDIAQRGGIPSGDFSREAQGYFIKKSNEFLENTNKSGKYQQRSSVNNTAESTESIISRLYKNCNLFIVFIKFFTGKKQLHVLIKH